MNTHHYAKHTIHTFPPEHPDTRWFAILDTLDDEGQEEIYSYGATEELALAKMFHQLPDLDPQTLWGTAKMEDAADALN